jgi:hypoxanthine phosphoribosyltransferase
MTAETSPHVEILISQAELRGRIVELAQEIRARHDGHNLLLVGVLKGSVYFLTELSLELGDKVELDFMQVASYHGEKTSSGIVQIRKDLDTNIENRHVLIVEDIVDTGATLLHLRELLATRRPASLEVVALLSKRAAREPRPELWTRVDYVGFEIPDQFVVGYGLDYGERFRNLPYIAILREA